MATAVKSKPILFSAPMVKAILAGTKTMTRRIVKPQPPEGWSPLACERYCPAIEDLGGEMRDGPEIFGAYNEDWGVKCQYGGPGDRLWVRESWRPWWDEDPPAGTGQWCCVQYKDGAIYKPGTNPNIPDIADENDGHKFADQCDKAPNIKWRSPIHMPRWASRITLEVTGVRVERLQEITEDDAKAEGCPRPVIGCALDNFYRLWNDINGEGSWEANPWVWAIAFRRVNQ